MGKPLESIDERLEAFIREQKMFFVATAPLGGGHVNVSPKGLDTLRVLDPHTLAYLDYVGSGVETIAHLRQNGRIVLMLCAFQGAPRIVRFHGQGSVVEPQDQEFGPLRELFPASPAGRAIITIAVERIADSCGHGVPLFTFEGNRPQLPAWAERKGPQGLQEYQAQKNQASIDGLPALRCHRLSPDDRQFREDFAAGRVRPDDFDHRAHVRLAYIYLAEHDAATALELMRNSLLAFIQHHNVPVAKYHETLTRAWILAVRHFMALSPGAESADSFIARNPVLLDSKIMLTHYSAEVLFSPEARARFVEPDLEAIPRHDG